MNEGGFNAQAMLGMPGGAGMMESDEDGLGEMGHSEPIGTRKT